MATKKLVTPGTGPQFPGPEYKIVRGTTPDIERLEQDIRWLSAELGPDHPKVKMLKKDLELKRRLQST
jgi:hypothetical protein